MHHRAWLASVVAIAASAVTVSAQQYKEPPEVTTAYAIANDVATSLRGHKIAGYPIPQFEIRITQESEINAHADATTGIVTIPVATVKFLIHNTGELAFVIAHEVGHIQDSGCREVAFQQGLRGPALQRWCEGVADNIGIQYMMAAGYDPFDAAAVMGRFMMLTGASETSIIGIIASRFSNDHPVDIDRIARMRETIISVCHDQPELCQ